MMAKELEQTVEERLAKFNGSEEAKELKSEEVKPDPEVEEVEEKEEEVKEQEDEEVKEVEEEDKESEKEPEKEAPALPENYFRAAVHQGMEPENIQKIFDADPDGALKLFESIYNSTNFISEQTSALGRTKRVEMQKALEAESKPEEIEYKSIDIDAIKKAYSEDDPGLVTLFEGLNAQNKQMFDMLKEQRQTPTPQSQQPSDEDKKVWGTINTFFSDKGMEVFSEAYGAVGEGKDWNTSLTGAQAQTRMEIIDEADLIMGGAKLQGRDMNYAEALSRAHLVASSKMQSQIAREQIHKEIKKRNKGITVKSTGKSSNKSLTPEQEEKALEKKTEGRLAKIKRSLIRK